MPDGYGGASFSAPQVVKCRWEDKQRMFRTATGEIELSRSFVYLDQEVDENGWMAQAYELTSSNSNWQLLTAEEDVQSVADSFTNSDGSGISPQTYKWAFPIRAVSRSVNVNATMFYRKVWV